MALIESIARRKNGTRVSFDHGKTEYHFKPDNTGAHVAEVKSPEHAERLLSVTGSYRLAVASKGKTEPVAVTPPVTATVLQRDGGSEDAGGTEETQPPAETSATEPVVEPPKPVARKTTARKSATKPKA